MMIWLSSRSSKVSSSQSETVATGHDLVITIVSLTENLQGPVYLAKEGRLRRNCFVSIRIA